MVSQALRYLRRLNVDSAIGCNCHLNGRAGSSSEAQQKAARQARKETEAKRIAEQPRSYQLQDDGTGVCEPGLVWAPTGSIGADMTRAAYNELIDGIRERKAAILKKRQEDKKRQEEGEGA